MKPFLEQLVADADDVWLARSLVREYLQARILYSLQQAGASNPLAFHGGTALRFLYDIPRYSEDLDFALERQREQYDFKRYLRGISTDLDAEGYTVDIRMNDQKVVNSALINFRGLWHELGLSPHQNQRLTIKLEVDTQPPAGAGLVTTPINRYGTLHWQHHDWGSLLAGKVHAILQRPYTKGRDWYDLVWYLTRSEQPQLNITMLNHALAQSGWGGIVITSENWREQVALRCEQLAWDRVVADVEPLIIDRADLGLLNEKELLNLLRKVG